MSSQSQNEPRRDLVPNVDSELSQASLPGTLRPREQLSFREQIEQGAGRAIVALESLPVIVEFFGAARGEGAGVGPHGISFSTLDERLRGSVLPTDIEREGAALFNSKESITSFLRAHAARIEAAPVEEQVKFFDEAQAKVIAALDQAKYDIYCLLDKTRCGPKEESDIGETRSYLLMAKVLGQLYEDGMPRPHLPHLEEIVQRGQESLQRTSEDENPPTRMPVDIAALAPLPEPMRDACNRMFNAVGRFVSPEMVLEHGLGSAEKTSQGSDELAKRRNKEVDHKKHRLIGGANFGPRDEARPLFALLVYAIKKRDCPLYPRLISDSDFLRKLDGVKQQRFTLTNLKALVREVAQLGKRQSTPEGKSEARVVLEITRDAVADFKKTAQFSRESRWCRDLLLYLERTFGYSLLKGVCEPASVPDYLRANTASSRESLILGVFLLGDDPSLSTQEEQLIARLTGARVGYIRDTRRWLTESSICFRRLSQPHFGAVASHPYQLKSMFHTLYTPGGYEASRGSIDDFTISLQLSCGAISDPRAVIALSNKSRFERQTFLSLAEIFMWEFGISTTQVEECLSHENASNHLVKLAEEERPSERAAQWRENRLEYKDTYEAALAFLSRDVPPGREWGFRHSFNYPLDDPEWPCPNTTDWFRDYLQRTLLLLLSESKDHSPRVLIHAAVILRYSLERDDPEFQEVFLKTQDISYESLHGLLLHNDPDVRDLTGNILLSSQIREWLKLCDRGSPEVMCNVIREAVSFAISSEGGSPVVPPRDRRDFMGFFVRHLVARVENLSTAHASGALSAVVNGCLREAQRNILSIQSPPNTRERAKEMSRMYEELSLSVRVGAQLSLIDSMSTGQSFSFEDQRYLARVLSQLPISLQDQVLSHRWHDFFERRTNENVRILDPGVLASSGVVWRLKPFLNRPEDFLLILEALSSIGATASKATLFMTAAELLRTGWYADSGGFQTGQFLRQWKSQAEQKGMREEYYFDLWTNFNEWFLLIHGDTALLAEDNLRAQRFFRESPYGLAVLRRLQVTMGRDLTPADVPGLGFDSAEQLAQILRDGPGLESELKVLQKFFIAFKFIDANYLFRYWRALWLNLSYNVWEDAHFWSIHWSNGDGRHREEVLSHLPKTTEELKQYVFNKAKAFVSEPDSFRVEHRLELEIAAMACNVLKDPEWHDLLQQSIETNRFDAQSDYSDSAFKSGKTRQARTMLVPGVSGENNRKVKDKTLVPGDGSETVIQRFSKESALFLAVVDKTSIPVIDVLSGKFGVQFAGAEKERGAEDHAGVVHRQSLKLAEKMNLLPQTELADKDLRDMFYAHVLSDRRMNGSALYTTTRKDSIERLAAFVELVTAGRTRPEWQEVLSRCNPELRARFDQLPDVTPLYGPLIERVNYSDPKAKPVELTLCLTRGIPSKFIGHISDSCARDTLEDHPNIGFVTFAENIKDKIPSFSGGFMLIDTKTEEGDRALIIRGYNPSKTLIVKLQIKALFEAVVDYAEGIARELGCTQILAPRDAIPGLAFSNRALGHIGFNIVYRDAPQVRVPRETTTYNDLLIDDKCVLVRAVKLEDKGKSS